MRLFVVFWSIDLHHLVFVCEINLVDFLLDVPASYCPEIVNRDLLFLRLGLRRVVFYICILILSTRSF
jgi:hypothetical protein